MSAKGTFFDASKNRLSVPASKLIYVEGADDAYFIEALLAAIGADPNEVRIELSGGKGGIPSALVELTKSSAYVRRVVQSVCVVRDADDDAVAAQHEFETACNAVGLPVVKSAQTACYDGGRKLALYLLPKAGLPGDLESLLLGGVTGTPRHDIATKCLETACAELGELDRKSKRLAQLYMAIHPEDCRGVGRAYALGAFPESDDVKLFKDFLEAFIK